MRLGCGCLVTILALIVVVGLGLAGIVVVGSIFSTPDFEPVAFTPSDGRTAQQRLFEVVLRQSGQSARRDPIVISEAEANAFLSRHLDQAGLPLSPIAVRFRGGRIVVQGQTPLRDLLRAPVVAQVAPYLGDDRLNRRIWVTTTARILVEGTGRQRSGRAEVEQFSVGRQPLGTLLFPILMGSSASRLLKWPMPPVVQEIRISDGRLEIRTR